MEFDEPHLNSQVSSSKKAQEASKTDGKDKIKDNEYFNKLREVTTELEEFRSKSILMQNKIDSLE